LNLKAVNAKEEEQQEARKVVNLKKQLNASPLKKQDESKNNLLVIIDEPVISFQYEQTRLEQGFHFYNNYK
jgi:hypothetical protein